MVDLKKLREAKGITQYELAVKLGVTQQTISQIECGKASPIVPNAKKLGKILGFDWTEFYETAASR